MPKTRRHRSRRHRSHRRRYRGGGGADTYELGVVGNGQTQFNNTFRINPNDTIVGKQSNVIRDIKDPSLGVKPLGVNFDSPLLKGGRRRRGSRRSRSRRSRRGGYWGEVVNQAVVPFALLAAQNRFSKKHKK
jgi:hypothetical protein